jgi:hypothetical protein
MDAMIRERVNETFSDDKMSHGLDHVESFGWTSEAHRLSRGTNRSGVELVGVGTISSNIRPLIKSSIATVSYPIGRWLAIFKLRT